jgi:ubiquitin-protein ligase
MATQPCLNKVILKEFKDTCYRSFAQDQITITFPDEEDLTKVEVILTPNEGVYRDARIVFSIDLTTEYPTRAPIIRCKTPVLHPNIEGDEICLNILDGTPYSVASSSFASSTCTFLSKKQSLTRG